MSTANIYPCRPPHPRGGSGPFERGAFGVSTPSVPTTIAVSCAIGVLDGKRRSARKELAEGSGVLLHVLPDASQADLDASSHRDIEGACHRGEGRGRSEGRTHHRPQSGPGRVEPREDERGPRLEPGAVSLEGRMVGDPERVDSRAIAHLRHLAHATRRVPRVEDDAQTGEPSRRGDGWPEATHTLDSTKPAAAGEPAARCRTR